MPHGNAFADRVLRVAPTAVSVHLLTSRRVSDSRVVFLDGSRLCVGPIAVRHAVDRLRVLHLFLGRVFSANQFHIPIDTVTLPLLDPHDVHGIDLDDVDSSMLEANLLFSITPGVEEDPLVGLEVVVVKDDRVEALAAANVLLGCF